MTVSIPLSYSQFISVSLFLLFVFANGNVMTNYELATLNSNHVPVTAKYSGSAMNMRDQSYSRNYHYPASGDDSLSNINNNWGGGRQMSSLAATSLQAPANNNDYGFGGDNYASANEPGYNSHSSYGSGHKPSVYVNNSAVGLLGFLSLLSLIQTGKSVCRLLKKSYIIRKGDNCNSALGLLGVLGLASYLQNVLRQMTTTAAPIVVVPPGRRRKREIITVQTARGFHNNHKEIDDVTDKMLPLLTAVGHARDGLIPLTCTRGPVCLVNKLLLDELGPAGKPIGSQLSLAITMMLKEVDKLGTIEKMISKASQEGAAGKDCEQLYTSCPILGRLPSYTVPPAMLM